MVSVACFGVRVLVMFQLMFVHYTFSSVWIAEWPPFLKELPTRWPFVLFVIFIHLPFWF